MDRQRRRLLAALATLPALPLTAGAARPATTPAASGRALIVGGGWGGLAAACALRRLAPEIEVSLIDDSPSFFSLPLSNRWLLEAAAPNSPLPNLTHEHAAAARRAGYRFIEQRVTAIEAAERRVRTASGERFSYDWLILALGISDNYAAWFGDAADASRVAQEKYASASQARHLPALQQRLAAFGGGDFVLTIPPQPYRCPPAPYERACALATLFQRRRIAARVVVLDPNPPMPAFLRVFAEAYAGRIAYMPQAEIRQIDPFARRISTDFDQIDFTDAILMPPQQAPDLVRQAGLAGSTAWAEFDPQTLRSPHDARIFIVGDMAGRASQLFGYYPKTAQIAASQGEIAARQIVAELRGSEPPDALPSSVCHASAGFEPPALIRLENTYRRRGDGLLAQKSVQTYLANPENQDIAWLQEMYRRIFATA